jgi:hypothetical protein
MSVRQRVLVSSFIVCFAVGAGVGLYIGREGEVRAPTATPAVPVDAAVRGALSGGLIRLVRIHPEGDLSKTIRYWFEPKAGLVAKDYREVKVRCDMPAGAGIYALLVDSKGDLKTVESISEPETSIPNAIRKCEFAKLGHSYVTLYSENQSK